MNTLKPTTERPIDPNDDGMMDEDELKRLGLYDQHRQCVVNVMPPAEEPKIYFFGNGEMLLDMDGGHVLLSRDDTVKLYTLLTSPRVKNLMLNVLRANLIEAGHGELMDEMLQMIDSFTPAQRRQAMKALEATVYTAPLKGAA